MSKETPEKDAPLQEQSVADIKKKLQEKREGTLVALPSGLVFKLKKPSIARLLEDDVFPQELVGVAIKMDSNTNNPNSREDYLKSLEVIDTIVLRAAVSPRVVKTEEEVDEADRQAKDDS